MATHQNNYSGGGKTKSGTQVSTKARRRGNPSGVGKIQARRDGRGLSSAPPAAPRLASEAPARLQTERCARVQRASQAGSSHVAGTKCSRVRSPATRNVRGALHARWSRVPRRRAQLLVEDHGDVFELIPFHLVGRGTQAQLFLSQRQAQSLVERAPRTRRGWPQKNIMKKLINEK